MRDGYGHYGYTLGEGEGSLAGPADAALGAATELIDATADLPRPETAATP